VFRQFLELHTECGAPDPTHDRTGNINRGSLTRPNLKMNRCISRHGNLAPHPTPSQGEILYNTFFRLHCIRGKDPLEIDGVTSVLALLSDRLHIALLMMPLIIRGLGWTVEEIVPLASLHKRNKINQANSIHYPESSLAGFQTLQSHAIRHSLFSLPHPLHITPPSPPDYCTTPFQARHPKAIFVSRRSARRACALSTRLSRIGLHEAQNLCNSA